MVKNLIKKETLLKIVYSVFLVLFSLFFGTRVFAVGPFTPGETLDPSCSPGDVDCIVNVLPTLTSGSLVFSGGGTTLSQDNSNLFWDDTNNRLGIGTATPSARLHLPAGTATASTAPLKFTSGTLLTTPEAGAVEFLTDAYYGTITTGGARKTFAFLESPTFTGTVTIPTPFTLGATSVTTTGTQLNYLSSASGTTGTGSLVFASSPTLTTPTLGVATATSLANGTFTTSSGAMTFTPASGSGLNINLATTGDFAVNTNQLYVDTSTGNVGIGTSSPTQQLSLTNAIALVNTTDSTTGVIYKGADRFLHNFAGSGTSGANVFIGKNSGNFTMGGTTNEASYNTALGTGTLFNLTTGSYNTGIGNSALYANTTGTGNTALGDETMIANTTGGYNTAVGVGSLYSNTTGDNNIAVGFALFNNTIGARNTALGYQAGHALTEGNNNILLGYQAGNNLTTGSGNIIIGHDIDAPSITSANTLSIGNLIYATGLGTTGTTVSTGNVGIGTASPSARLHLPAGTATASTAPLKFTSGTNLTTPEAGAMEWDGTNLYITQTSGPSRKTISFTDSNITGNSATATALETARNIQGVSFNGSGNIDIISGTGFVKVSGTTLSYDNSTYLTSADLSSYVPYTGASGTVNLGSNDLTVGAITTTGNLGITGSIIPSVDITYDLGSLTNQWRDVYIGPGSLYINGQKVLEESGTDIVVSADINQNLAMQTSGTGNLELNPTGSGQILLKGNIVVSAGKTFETTDNSAIDFNDGIQGGNIKILDNEIRPTNTNGSIDIAPIGLGATYISSGNFGVGTTGPLSKLSVNGGVAIGTYADATAAPSNGLIISGNIGIGVTSPSARLHLPAGTATASTAPLKFTSGTLLTTPEAGAVEFLTDAYYGTITTGGARKTFAFLESPTFTGTVTIPTPFTLGATSVTSTGTQLNYLSSASGTTGTGSLVFASSPTLTTPTIASLIGNKIYPSSDSTTAIQITKANGSTSVLNVDTTNGRIGIGTTTPSGIFHIYGSGEMLRLDSTGSGGYIDIRESGTLRGYIGYGDSGSILTNALSDSISIRAQGALHLGAGGDKLAVTVATDGRVGIGTTSPSSRLHVATTTTFTGSVLTLDGTYTGGASTFSLTRTDAGYLYGSFVSNGTLRGYYGIDNATSGGTIGTNTQAHAFSINARSGPVHLFYGSDALNGITISTSNNVGIGVISASTKLEIGSSDLGDGVAGPVITLGRNTNATNTGAGSINFLAKGGTSGYVWQDVAGNMRIHTSAPSNANDTAGTVIGAQTSTRDTKQDIEDYEDYGDALDKILNTPLHTFRYIKEVEGYGTDSPLAKTRLGYIADEVDPIFMVGNVIDQVSVNGILIASIKALNLKLNDINNLEKENSWRDALVAWLANATNKITRIFTGEICLTSPGEEPVCLNASELRTLKSNMNSSQTIIINNSGSSNTTENTNESTTENTDTSTDTETTTDTTSDTEETTSEEVNTDTSTEAEVTTDTTNNTEETTSENTSEQTESNTDTSSTPSSDNNTSGDTTTSSSSDTTPPENSN